MKLIGWLYDIKCVDQKVGMVFYLFDYFDVGDVAEML